MAVGSANAVVGPRVLSFIERHTLDGTKANRASAVRSFAAFLLPFNVSVATATMDHVTTFLLDLVESGRVTSAQTIQDYLSAIDTHRVLLGARRFQSDQERLWQLFKDAIGKALPRRAPIDVGKLPAVVDLVPFLPGTRLLRDRVARVALLVRMVACLRSGDALRIRRSSIERTMLNGIPVVRFRYTSKMSTRLNAAYDVNYVEELDDAHRAICPARALLALRVEVDDLMAGLAANERHDWVMVDIRRPYASLSADSIGRYARDLLDRWAQASGSSLCLTGHKLRLIAADSLKGRGVSHASLCIRAGWKPDAMAPWSTVLQHIYQSRAVPENFARVLLVQSAGTVSERRL